MASHAPWTMRVQLIRKQCRSVLVSLTDQQKTIDLVLLVHMCHNLCVGRVCKRIGASTARQDHHSAEIKSVSTWSCTEVPVHNEGCTLHMSGLMVLPEKKVLYKDRTLAARHDSLVGLQLGKT